MKKIKIKYPPFVPPVNRGVIKETTTQSSQYYLPGSKLLLLTLICFGYSLFTIGCKTKEVPLPPYKAFPQQEMYGVEMTLTQTGKVRSNVHAKKVVQMMENDALTLSGAVHVVFLDSLGVRTGFMDSKTAIVDENRNKFQAIDSVHVWSDESKAALDTKTLNWNPTTQRIETNDSVTITTHLDTLHGVGLIADQGLHYWEIQHPIGVSYRKVPERKPRDTSKRDAK